MSLDWHSAQHYLDTLVVNYKQKVAAMKRNTGHNLQNFLI